MKINGFDFTYIPDCEISRDTHEVRYREEIIGYYERAGEGWRFVPVISVPSSIEPNMHRLIGKIRKGFNRYIRLHEGLAAK